MKYHSNWYRPRFYRRSRRRRSFRAPARSGRPAPPPLPARFRLAPSRPVGHAGAAPTSSAPTPPLPPRELSLPDSRQVEAILRAWRECEAAWTRAHSQLRAEVRRLAGQTALLAARIQNLRNP